MNKYKTEIWKNIKGYEGHYQISNLGRCESVKKKYCHGRFKKEKIDKVTGYLTYGLWRNGKGKSFLKHRLIAMAFIPNPENKPEINHKNGNKKDCGLENLEWCTKSENTKHAYKIGLKNKKGESHHLAKLKNIDVQEIRRLGHLKVKHKIIAKMFLITAQNVSKIVARKRWNHI